MNGKRALILSEAFGTGHTMAAEAIREGAKLFKPDWEFRVLELGANLSPHLSRWIARFYMKTIRYSPKLWGAVYRKGQHQPLRPTYEFLLHRLMYNQIQRVLEDYQPDFIVCTHPFPSAVISRLKRLGLKIPLYTVITDYGIHGAWISSGVDVYFVPSMKVRDQMIGLGVDERKIQVTGIPTHPKFWIKKEKSAVRAKLGLADQPTLLCMGGGLGLGLSEALLDTIAMFQNRMQILFVAGKNRELYQKLQERSEFRHPNFRLYAFVDFIDELMDASDLLITKPGGITCSEAIAKGIPMILLEPIPGQEEDNLQYLLEQRLGVAATPSENAGRLLEQLLENLPKELPLSPTPAPGGGKRLIEQLIHHAG
jgi:processive 1,2-diacylglycerol beta-glucosyltransferase